MDLVRLKNQYERIQNRISKMNVEKQVLNNTLPVYPFEKRFKQINDIMRIDNKMSQLMDIRYKLYKLIELEELKEC